LVDSSVRLNTAVREFTERAGQIDAQQTAAAQIAAAAKQLDASGISGEPTQSLARAVSALCEINTVLLQRVGELERKLERPS